MTQRENLYASAEAKSQADQGSANAEKRFDVYAKFVKYLWFICVAIALGTLWIGKMQWNQSQHDTDITTLKSDVKLNKALIDAHEIQSKTTFAERLNIINILTTRVEAMEKLTPQVTEMWFMKTHGISNHDAFFQEHGYQAPKGPGDGK